MSKYFLFLLLFLCLFSFAVAEDLSVSVTADKNQYSLGEEVVIAINLNPLNPPTSFFDTYVYLMSSDLGEYLSFNEGNSQTLTEKIYPMLSKSEPSGSYINAEGTYYGWWIFATSPADKITLTTSKPLAKFSAKIIAAPTSSTPITITIDPRSKIVTYGAGFAEEKLSLKFVPATITVLPSVASKETVTPKSGSSSCTESWTCSQWSDCVSGTQLRVCQDEHKCSTTFNKPKEKQFCTEEVTSTLPVQEQMEDKPLVEKTPAASGNNTLFWVILIVIILLVIGTIMILLLVLRKKSSSQEISGNDQFRSWIEQQHQRNLSDEQSKQLLLQQGWTPEQVEEAFKKMLTP